MLRFVCILFTSLLLGCSLAPKMKPVDLKVPAKFKEAKEERPTDVDSENSLQASTWKKAEPSDDKDRGQWWKIFDDDTLNEYETLAQENSPTLKAAASRVTQARAFAKVQSSALFPSIDIGGDAAKIAYSSASQGLPAGTSPTALTLYRAHADVSYEADLFGKLSDTAKAAKLEADAADATYRSVMLALQADIAQNYFTLRAIDEERKTVKENVDIRAKSEQLMKVRLHEGYESDLDYARAQTELANAKVDLILLDKQRAITEHGLALLLGKAPADFTFEEGELIKTPPEIPAGLPSDLLERRPDISSAQKIMAASNAKIGVAKSAFFPSLTLTALGGFESADLSNLFKWSSRTWALGPLAGTALTLPIFEGGRNMANLKLAKASYEESVSNYKEQVLVAFRDVEDSLSNIRLLKDQEVEESYAVASARRTAKLSNNRYEEGDLSYLEVVDAQRSLLNAERSAAELKGQRLIATVSMIRALGGGWN